MAKSTLPIGEKSPVGRWVPPQPFSTAQADTSLTLTVTRGQPASPIATLSQEGFHIDEVEGDAGALSGRCHECCFAVLSITDKAIKETTFLSHTKR